MKRMMQAATALLVIMFLFIPWAGAENLSQAQWDALDTEQLSDLAGESGADLELGEGFDLNKSLSSLWTLLQEKVQGALRTATRSGALLLVVILFCEVSQLIFAQVKGMEGTTAAIGSLAVTAIAVSDVSSMIGYGRTAISQIAGFSQLLIPVLTASAAASGSVTGATARQAATLLLANVLVTAIERVLVPFVYLYVCASAAGAALDNEGLRAISKFFKWAITFTLTTLLLLFTIYLSLTNFAAGGADAVAIKLTRTVISNLVPVVGSILSDASETVLVGAVLCATRWESLAWWQ